MAEIADKLEVIQSAEYGEQVRGSIYEALVAINKELTDEIANVKSNLGSYKEDVNGILSQAQGSIDTINTAAEVAAAAVKSIQQIGNIKVGVDLLPTGQKAVASFTEETSTLYFGIPYPKDGTTGAAGKDGTTTYTHIAFSSSPTRPREAWRGGGYPNIYFDRDPIEPGYRAVTNPTVVSPLWQGYLERRVNYDYSQDEEYVDGKTYYDLVGNTYEPIDPPTGVPNPSQLGYYEYDATNRTFVASEDTIQATNKTYYVYKDSAVPEEAPSYTGRPNPKALGYYELNESSEKYVTSMDSAVDVTNTYYIYDGDNPVAVENPGFPNPVKLGFYERDPIDTNKYYRTADVEVVSADTNYRYKGSVAAVTDLPSSGNATGDVYSVTSANANYAWNGTEWIVPSDGVIWKTYYREIGSRWIGFQTTTSPTAGLSSLLYKWVNFRGPKGETGAGVPDMTANLEALDGRKVGTTENLYPVASVGRFNGQPMTADKYKGYDAVLVWLQYLTQETFWITTTVGKLTKKTGSKMQVIDGPTTKNAKKNPMHKDSKAFTYVAFKGGTKKIRFWNELVPILVPKGGAWVSVSHIGSDGETSSRRIRYDSDTGRIEFSDATVGTVYNDKHGSYCYDSATSNTWLEKYQYKNKKTGKAVTVKKSYEYTKEYKNRAHSNMWLVPVAIHGVKNLGRDLPLTAP